MIDKIKDQDGWAWPAKDAKCWPWLQREKDLPDLISKYVSKKQVCVQAGGNAGFYVKKYAELFNFVYTFEPDPTNFYCMVENVKDANVYKFQCCLGEENKMVGITNSKGNAGCYSVKPNAEKVTIPCIKLDNLALEQCDLIHYDIEGFEWHALKGSEQTIKAHSPLIALEWMDHGIKYGKPQTDIEMYLNSLGYKEIDKIYHEKIFSR